MNINETISNKHLTGGTLHGFLSNNDVVTLLSVDKTTKKTAEKVIIDGVKNGTRNDRKYGVNLSRADCVKDRSWRALCSSFVEPIALAAAGMYLFVPYLILDPKTNERARNPEDHGIMEQAAALMVVSHIALVVVGSLWASGCRMSEDTRH